MLILVGAAVPVLGASRTDAGVHARGQVASFSIDQLRIPVDRVAMALNTRLPRDLEVVRADEVDESFDPVRSCVSKSYSYRLRIADGTRPRGLEGRATPFERRFTTVCRHAVDLARVRAAAARVVGTHDFRAFAHEPDQRETTVRTVLGCTVTDPEPGIMRFDVSGSGFLHHMVRILVGTLLEAGRGRIEPSDIDRIIAQRDRSEAGPTMPPEGLCLEWIHYGQQYRFMRP
ncbi:MAG: tRNA pseudouridine synthase A [Planctomycetota bacterium]